MAGNNKFLKFEEGNVNQEVMSYLKNILPSLTTKDTHNAIISLLNADKKDRFPSYKAESFDYEKIKAQMYGKTITVKDYEVVTRELGENDKAIRNTFSGGDVGRCVSIKDYTFGVKKGKKTVWIPIKAVIRIDGVEV